MAGLGVIASGISSAITGIISTKLNDVQSSNRSLLLASSALIGFGTVILIIAFGLLFGYLSAKRHGVKKKGLIITFWILFGLYVALAAIGAGLAAAAMGKEELKEYQQPLLVAAVLPIATIILFPIGFLILRIGARRFNL